MRHRRGIRRRAGWAAAALVAAGCGGAADTASVPLTPPPLSAAAPSTTTAPPSTASAAGGRYLPPPPTSTGRCRAVNGLPDPACTPGATDPVVSTATLETTVCHKGYSAAVRPPLSYTAPIKRERMAAYGIDEPLGAVELDHLIPISLGGDPRAVANLWPETWEGADGARVKDRLELRLLQLVCRHQVELATAQAAIATDWVAAYSRYLG